MFNKEIDAISITNHNVFDLEQYENRDNIRGIEMIWKKMDIY